MLVYLKVTGIVTSVFRNKLKAFAQYVARQNGGHMYHILFIAMNKLSPEKVSLVGFDFCCWVISPSFPVACPC